MLMKVETKYVCEICGGAYNIKARCEECEQSHVANLKIISCKQYDPYEIWPQYIKVQCKETGNRATYEIRYPATYEVDT